ncbi:MAG: hypothetical protein JO198_04685 [Candidatus Dormibacteraeota bacterium]|nr:hypothetical protein [Candidatus Dormibacteraeota bacterium]
MHTTRGVRIAAAAAAACAIGLLPVVASAHAVITVGGYHVAIGWQYEPPGGSSTYVGQPNGVQVFIDTLTATGDIGSPVGDLNSDCSHPDFQVTVTFDGKTSSPLCPMPTFDPDTASGRMDEYDAVLTPTKVGDYTFRIFGSIHGTAIDKSATSGPSTFDTVADQSAVDFPTAAPALGDVAAKVDQVGNRAADAAASAASAADTANRASTIAIIAVIVAALLGAANLAVVLRRRRS